MDKKAKGDKKMNPFYIKNTKLLKEKDKLSCNIIEKLSIDPLKYQVLKSKTGEPTLQVCDLDDHKLHKQTFLLHSKYDPYRAENEFIDKNFDCSKRNIIVYGFALGYHIDLLLKRISNDQNVYIIEANAAIIKAAFMARDLSHIISHKQVSLILLSNEQHITNMTNLLNDTDSLLLIHQASIKAIPYKYKRIADILNEFTMMQWGIQKNQELLIENHLNNTSNHYKNISKLFNKVKKLPIFIVSAGPSLNANKHLLHQVKDDALIFCVGSAFKTLVRENVHPHLFCIIDPQPITYKQIEGLEDSTTPLVFLATASHFTVSKYKGPKYIVFNEKESLKEDEEIIETGGSVATAVLDMAIKFGGNPIVFIGQDLAFSNYEHHAERSMYGEEEMIKDLPNLKKVEGHDGQVYATSSSLLSFKNWIERKIEQHPKIHFINATQKGALIKGCQHLELEKVIDLYIEDNSEKLKVFLDRLKNL